MNKFNSAYKTIGEVAKILTINSKNGEKIPTHTIRFWEKEFKQIKPRLFKGNRRHYDNKNIEILKMVHFLLKEQGMTINGVKKILDKDKSFKLDEISNQSIRTDKLKKHLFRISKLVKSLKKT